MRTILIKAAYWIGFFNGCRQMRRATRHLRYPPKWY